MTLFEVRRLTRRIERGDPRCHITGTRRYGPGDYALDVTDTRTGTSFTLNSPADWEERVRAADSALPTRG